MTPDDIIRMARKAGYTGLNDPWLHTFAAFVAARTVSSIDPSQFMSYREGFEAGAIAEREACAKVCDEWVTANHVYVNGAIRCGLAIRARGQT